MKVPLFVSRQDILGGRPFVAGTGISILDILHWLAEGKTIRQIIKEHRELSEDAVRGAIQYAALILESPGDDSIRRAALDRLLELGYGRDTEDAPPGAPQPPDMSVPTAYMGRTQGK